MSNLQDLTDAWRDYWRHQDVPRILCDVAACVVIAMGLFALILVLIADSSIGRGLIWIRDTPRDSPWDVSTVSAIVVWFASWFWLAAIRRVSTRRRQAGVGATMRSAM